MDKPKTIREFAEMLTMLKEIADEWATKTGNNGTWQFIYEHLRSTCTLLIEPISPEGMLEDLIQACNEAFAKTGSPAVRARLHEALEEIEINQRRQEMQRYLDQPATEKP